MNTLFIRRNVRAYTVPLARVALHAGEWEVVVLKSQQDNDHQVVMQIILFYLFNTSKKS